MKAAGKPAKHVVLSEYILIDPEILGGDPGFRGTRVPDSSLFEGFTQQPPPTQEPDRLHKNLAGNASIQGNLVLSEVAPV